MKPKENKGYNLGTYDLCQTPPYALDPLIPYLNPMYTIWECAGGMRTLERSLRYDHGRNVFSTDITDPMGNGDFFLITPTDELRSRTIIVTNPPYSIKYEWLAQCYFYEMPFALLMPVEMIGAKKAQILFEKHGIQIIYMRPRVDFYMPEKGWERNGAQFPVAWYTWKLNLPKEINFAELNKPKKSELDEYWKEALS